MTPSILVLNAGSSSVKFAVFEYAATPSERQRGELAENSSSPAEDAAAAAIRLAGNRSVAAIGHRIVHGGPLHDAPVVLDRAILAGLHEAIAFAPNHLPSALRLIEAMASARPDLPQVACFDTTFHRDLPAVARRLPVPAAYDAAGVRRYGFHGLSCAHVVDVLRRRDGDLARGRVIVAHLGSGSSLTAIRDGRSIDTSMGLTPLGGVVMSTRSGDIDPGVVAYIARRDRLDGDAIEALFSRESGLKAIAGDTGDMKALMQRTDEDARLAVEMFVYQVRKWIGALSAALGGLDALVFTGGIGEHAGDLRLRICAGLEHLGRFAVRVIAADEEAVIARDVFRVLEGT